MCIPYRKKISTDMKIALKMCPLRGWNFHSFHSRRLNFDYVWKSVVAIHAYTTDDNNLMEKISSFFFSRDSLSYLIAVDFINVPMTGKCNNRNIFSSAKFVGRYNAYTFLLCDLGVRRILIAYRKISDGLWQTMDAIACLGILKYETLVIKTFQFYLLIHTYIENWI